MLPFENMSRNPDEDYFADGICEDLTTALSKLSGRRYQRPVRGIVKLISNCAGLKPKFGYQVPRSPTYSSPFPASDRTSPA